MLMTEEQLLSNRPLEELLERKRQLENGLSAATMHGVDAPPELLSELQDTQRELARRLDCTP